MDVTVQTDGFRALERKLTMASKRVENALGMTVRTHAELIKQDAQQNAPVEEGTLKAAFGVLKKGLEAAAYNTAEHARPVEFGADPHPIAPSSADRLRFFWEKKGRMFVGRPGQAVDHPGMEGKHYFRDAIRKQWPRLVKNAKQNVKRALDL